MSHRRVDAARANRLRERLAALFGADRVTDGGRQAVSTSGAVLVMIGPEWFEAVSASAAERSGDDEAVRALILNAIALGKLVVAVLVQGTTMPRPDDVGDDLRSLTGIPAFTLRDERFDRDATALAEEIGRRLGGRWSQPGTSSGEPSPPSPPWTAPTSGLPGESTRGGLDHPAPAPSRPTAPPASPRPVPPAPDPAPRPGGDTRRSDRDVQVTVHRPSAMKRGELTRMPVFVHRARDESDVVELSRAVLGPDADHYESIRQDGRIDVRRGWEIVINGWIDGGTCNPESVAYRWNGTLQHAMLLIRYDGADDVARGGVRVFANGVILAESTFAISVETATSSAGDPLSMIEARPRSHQRVFASYSHKDKSVVRYVAAALRTLGQEYIVDSEVLRSGEDWADRLDDLIRTADAFQLFWSKHSMRSVRVQHEWELALSLHRDNFVFPVYWQDPRPTDPPLLPPAELDKIHFSKLELPGRIATFTRRFR